MTHPLDLPEILHRIGLFFSSYDCYSYCLVSRSWNAVFNPLLYSDIFVEIRGRSDIPLESLIKNENHIKLLCLNSSSSIPYYSLQCPRLTKLNVNSVCTSEENILQHSQLVYDMIFKHKDTLNDVGLSAHHKPFPIAPWDALAECPQLREVSLCQVTIFQNDAASFWKACSKLFRLNYTQVSFASDEDSERVFDIGVVSESGEVNPGLGFDHLKRLYFEGYSAKVEDTVELFKVMRNLEYLNWTVPKYDTFPSEKFKEALALNTFSKLQHFRLKKCGLDDSDLTALLQTMVQVKVIDLYSSNYSSGSHNALLSNHSSTLGELCLGQCSTITSSMVLDILTSCHCLEYFEAFKILGSDVARYQWEYHDEATGVLVPEERLVIKDWVCSKLRKLVVYFDMSSEGLDIDQSTTDGKDRFERQQRLEQEQVFRQLSRLNDLITFDCRFKYLKISNSKYLSREESKHCKLLDSKGLKFKLQSRGGELERLSGLKNLGYFSFAYSEQGITDAELDWMAENWPRLRQVYGGMTHQQERYLKERNPEFNFAM